MKIKTSGIVVYLKTDERLKEYIKVKEKYYAQSSETGLTKEEKLNYKNLIKNMKIIKTFTNIRNHQNIIKLEIL